LVDVETFLNCGELFESDDSLVCSCLGSHGYDCCIALRGLAFDVAPGWLDSELVGPIAYASVLLQTVAGGTVVFLNGMEA